MNNIKQVNIQYFPSPEEMDESRTLKAGKFLWPGFTHVYPVFSKQLSGGKYRYQTGLSLKETTEDRKEEIEQAIKEIEEYYGEGSLDPFNHDFWKDVHLTITKKNTFLDIQNNIEHKLLYYVIKGGGIHEVAASYDELLDGASQKKWYMVEPEEFAEISSLSNRDLDRAISKLVELDEEKTRTDMFLVHKVLISSDRGTTDDTPKSALYKDLSDFIHGRISKTLKTRTPKQFVDTYNLIKENKKRLFIHAYVKDAFYFNFLISLEDGNLQNIETKTKYGSTIEKAVEFLSNPANQTELENLKERVEAKWKQ